MGSHRGVAARTGAIAQDLRDDGNGYSPAVQRDDH